MANPTWKTTSNDSWTTAGDWSTGTVPGAGDAVTIAQGDPQVTTAVPTVASVTDSADLSIEGAGSLTTTGDVTDTGFLGVDDNSVGGSSLTVGGTLTDSGTLMIGNNGLTSTATVSAKALDVTGTSTLEIHTASTGQATLKVNGVAGFGTTGILTGNLDLAGNAAIQFASGEISSLANGAALFLNGATALIQEGGVAGNSALTGLSNNAGTINMVGGSIVSTTTNLVNTGNIGLDGFGGLAGGSTLVIGGLLTNSNNFSGGSGSKVTTNGITNTGSVNMFGGSFGGVASTLTVNGALNNSNSLTLGNNDGTSVTASAQSLTNTGTMSIYGTAGVQSTLIVAAAAGFGSAGVLTGNVNLVGDSLLQFTSGQITDIATNSELTLNDGDSYLADASAPASNSALTGLATIEGALYFRDGSTLTTTGGLTNKGTLEVDDISDSTSGGSKLTVNGTLTNSNYVQIGNTFSLNSPTTVTANALSNTGQLEIRSSSATTLSTLNVKSAAGFGTTGTLTGSVDLNGDASIVFASGEITDIAASGELTLNNATSVIADAGATTSNSALTGLATIEGTFYLRDGSTLTTTGGLTNTGNLNIDDDSDNTSGGSKLTINGTLTNSHYVQIGNYYGLNNPTTVTANALSNTGQLEIRSNSATTLSTLNVKSAAGFGTTGKLTGSVDLNNDASIVFASGQITDIAGSSELTLNNATSVIADAGATTSNSALTGLATIEGTFYLRDGSTLTTTGGLTNTGNLNIDDDSDNTSGGSKLTINGTLTNSNYVQIGNYYALNNPTTVTANALSNTGQLEIRSSSATTLSTLNVKSAAGFGTTGTLTGHVDLNGDASIVFASGEITDIAASSELTLNNATSVIADAGATTSNSALTGLATIEGSLDLRDGSTITTTGGLTNSGSIVLDDNNDIASGGSKLTVNGTLTNNNYVQIGNYYGLNNPTTVTANALSNTGQLEVRSSSATTLSTLNVKSAAGFGTTGKLTGSVDLNNDASIVFASGQITDIAASSELTLNNATSVIADAGATTSNSALTGLATIEGSLDLRDGSTITTTGGLTDSGSIVLDDNNDIASGGSKLTVNGTLTNSNYVQIGNYYGLNNPTTVTTNALSNTGQLEIRSSSATTLSTLNVKSAAGFGTAGKLTGSVDLNNDASIVFASGQITDIAGSSELTLNNATSVIADVGATTSNSALTGLATIEGSLYLRDGSTITTTGGLTNSGNIVLDDNNDIASGGSKLTVNGTLTNSGNVQIGNYYGLNNPTTVTVDALANTGTLDLRSTGQAKPATLTVKGLAANNGGQINIGAFNTFTDQGFTQGTTGSVTLEIQGQTAGQFSTIATTGAVALNGGALDLQVDNTSLAAGQTYNLMTLTGGDLSGIFNTLDINNTTGDGTSVNLGNGLTAGLVYGDAAGDVQLQVVATPTATVDTFTGGTGSWGTAGNWSTGTAPTFYSDVVIGSTASAKVTLSTDATVNSLTLNTSDTLTSTTGTDLSIGSTVSVGTGAILTVGGEMFADGAATDNGSIVVNGTVADIRGASTGTGTYTIGQNATLEFGSSESNTVDFGAAHATLKLDAPGQTAGTLSGLVATDAIDLVGTSVSSFGVAGNTLTVTEGNGTVLNYTLANQQSGTAFTSQSDGAGGTELVLGTTTVPSFTAVTESPASGDLGIGATGTITLTASVAATVTGAPTLTLNDNAVATYDAAKSTSTKLVFDYTVAAGQNAASLAATTLNLANGAAIKDGSGNNFNAAIGTLSQTGPQIDTTAPSISITSQGGNVASASQTVAGTVDSADVGTTVSLYDNGGTTAVGTATVQTNGTWSSVVTLAKGANDLVAKDTDAAGNTGTSNTVLYTFGVAPATTETLATDSGSNGTDKLTNVDTVTGTGDDNAVVSFTIDNVVTSATATANASGVYSYTPTNLADGSHLIVASESNSFGTTTASLTFTLDTTAPTVAITSTGGNVTTASQTVNGTVDAADAGTTVNLYDNGSSTALGTATVGSNGAWTTNVTLVSGANSIVAKDTDAAGNTGSSSAVSYSVGVVPTVSETLATDSGSSSTDKITNVDTVTGTGDANAVVSFTIDGAAATTTATANASGVYSYTPASLADGSHTIVASETNGFGTSTASLTFTLDTAKPAVTEVLATDTGTSATDKITDVDTVNGSGDANAIVSFTVDGIAQSATATANASGAYSFTPTGLSDATHTIIASETDVAGNTGTASLAFVQDTTAPKVAITSAGGSVTAASQTVAGTVTDANPGATVTLYDNGSATALGTATVGTNGAWTTNVTLASGANSIVAKDTDLAGNTGSSAAVVYTLGAAPPLTEALATDSGSSSTDKITNVDTVTGAAAANAVVSFTIDGKAATTTTTANASGVYSYTPSNLADGSHTIVASETNGFGTSTASLTFTLDTAKPAVTEVLATDTGTSSTDKITDVDTVNGSGDANAVVHFTVDGIAQSGTATANASGAYTFTPTGLTDGSHTIVASETDVAGNTGTASLAFVQDTTAPKVAITSAGGSVTAASQTIAGTVTDANPGATVTLYDNGSATALGTATVATNGSWTTNVTLASGANSIVAKDTDLAGNTGSSAAVVYNLSIPRPTVIAVSGSPSRGNLLTGQTDAITLTMSTPVTVTGAPTLSLNDGGTATYDAQLSTATNLVFDYKAKAGQSVQELAISGVNLPAGASVENASGGTASFAAAGVNLGVAVNFTQTITGTEDLEVVGPSGETDIFAKNAAGTLTLDKSAQYTGTVQGLTATDTLDLTDLAAGTADKATYAGTTTGGTLTVTDGKTTSTLMLTGDYTTSKFFVANDGSGGVAVTEVALPAITEALASDTGASKTDKVTNNPTLTGGGDANATVTFSENGQIIGTTTANAAGKWTYKPALADGTQTVVASETNAAGTATAALTFTLDTVKPAVTEVLATDTGTSATDKITSKDTLTGTGDPNATVSFKVDGTAVAATVQANANGVWSFTPAGLADGSHTVVASETDLAGNVGTASLKFTLDTTPPNVDITSQGGDVTAVSQTITGTGEAGTTVNLFDGTAAIGTALTVGKAGTWSETISLPALGTNAITAQDTDAAGNIGTSAATTYTLLNVPPTITSGGGGGTATYIVNQGSAPVTTVSATDPDPGDSVTYGLLGADGKPLASVPNFSIDQTTGALTLTGSPAAGTYNATVTATDNHGASSTQGIKVDVDTQGLMLGDTGQAGVTDTFVFNPNFGVDFVQNFRVANVTSGGAIDPHSVLDLNHALFTGATAGETGTNAVALLGNASVQFGKDTLIYASNNNVIDLQGVNRANLLAHPTDFAFT